MSRMLFGCAVVGLLVAAGAWLAGAERVASSSASCDPSCDAVVGIVVAEPAADCGLGQPCPSWTTEDAVIGDDAVDTGYAEDYAGGSSEAWQSEAGVSNLVGHSDFVGHSAVAESLGPDDPLGVLAGQIHNKRLYDTFVRVGLELLATPRGLDLAAIQKPLRSNFAADRLRPTVASTDASFPYRRVAQSSVMLGTLYDCGKCDDMHGNVAGGVIISADGLCLTNHHVLERRDEDTKLLFAMDYAGRGYAIEEVLAVNRQADVALIRLSGDGPFVPCPLASEPPQPNVPAYVLSHPSNEFFVLTQGIVSRHVTLTHRRGSSQWLEITAPFGAGSSGSGIFNDRGELIGLVSRIQPIFRSPSQINAPDDGAETRPGRAPYAELILRRCVTLEAIQRCFEQ